ncbi:MAG: transposase [Isosphaeraceae bacterium]
MQWMRSRGAEEGERPVSRPSHAAIPGLLLHPPDLLDQGSAAPDPTLQARLYDYLGGILRIEGSPLLAAGGMPDHVHLLVSLGRSMAIADLLRIIKANSSRWVHGEFPTPMGFAWQAGYAAFSVSASNRGRVEEYIQGQAEHHRTVTFQDEYRAFLRRHGIAFDERYVWD